MTTRRPPDARTADPGGHLDAPVLDAGKGRVAVVDDHDLLAFTLAAALRGRGLDVTIVGLDPATDPTTAILDASPTTALLDLDLGPHGDATRLIEPLTTAGVAVVMVTGVTDPVRVGRCIAAGAVGVLSKQVPFEVLVETIGRVAAGQPLLTAHERDEHLAVIRGHERSERERLAPFESLTPREAEVLGALMAGQKVQEIAIDRVVSLATVRSQVRTLLLKLDVSSQVAAISRAHAAGWVPPQETPARSPDGAVVPPVARLPRRHHR